MARRRAAPTLCETVEGERTASALSRRSKKMRKLFEIGGLVAAVVLIAFGVVTILMGVNGRNTVSSSLKTEQITGSPDMTPSAITVAAKEAGLTNVAIPSCSVANQAVTTGAQARCFAQYMQIHALEATGGFVYAQMGQFTAKPGTPKAELTPDGATSNKEFALLDPKTQQPVSNGARNVWVTETALTTALNTSFMATQLGLFAIVVGIALLLSGFGFAILAIGGALRNPATSLTWFSGKSKVKGVVHPA
jgi:F0F1-type ATP synthase membrane subunit c/vacuolar-type H+-ATPase subunit K